MSESNPTPDLSALRIPKDDPEPEGMNVWRWILAVVVAAVAAAAGGWYFLHSRAPVVRVATVLASGGGAEGGANLSANGYVVARTRASVSAKVLGRLVRLDVQEGSRIAKDDVIALIEDGDFRAALDVAAAAVKQAEAQADLAERSMKRARELAEKSFISTTDLEQAEAASRVAQAQLASARANAKLAAVNLESTRVRAPFDGTILRKDAELGEMVAPASAGGGLTRTAIVTMADLDTLEVEVDVNEAYISRIRPEQPARITLEAYPLVGFRGKVRQVLPTADRQKASVLVKVSILDKDPRIMPEMASKVVFLDKADDPSASAEPRRITVPAEAVVKGKDGDRVWIVNGTVVKTLAVKTGAKIGAEIEIASGLSGGEKVVVDPPANLRDGQSVRIGS